MSVSINGTGGITFADTSTQNTGGYTGFRNRIINGAMMIDQRNAGASVSYPTPTQAVYTLDRYFIYGSQASKFTVQQNAGSVTPPIGFTNYLGCTSSSAYSITATDQFFVRQIIEGLNCADFGWGTANAQSVTLSFWVRSSLTGTFGGSLQNSAATRCYPFSYTVNSANTWEQKTITIAGDTSGTWLTTNGIGIQLTFSLGSGSTYSATAGAWNGSSYITSATGATSVVGTNGATFYITGVQLEKGSVATPFEFRPYGTELALCQRYYRRLVPDGLNDGTLGTGVWGGTTVVNRISVAFPVTMRVIPTIGAANLRIYNGISPTAVTSFVNDGTTTSGGGISVTASGGAGTAGQAGTLLFGGTGSPYLDFSAEL